MAAYRTAAANFSSLIVHYAISCLLQRAQGGILGGSTYLAVRKALPFRIMGATWWFPRIPPGQDQRRGSEEPLSGFRPDAQMTLSSRRRRGKVGVSFGFRLCCQNSQSYIGATSNAFGGGALASKTHYKSFII